MSSKSLDLSLVIAQARATLAAWRFYYKLQEYQNRQSWFEFVADCGVRGTPR